MPRFSRFAGFFFASSLAVMSNISNAGTINQPRDFYWQTYQPETDSKLYERCGKICPAIDYQLIDTGNSWLDTTMNKAVINGLGGIEGDSPQLKMKQDKFNALPIITQTEAVTQLNATIASLIADNNEIIKIRGKDWDKDNTSPVQSSAHPEYLGHKTLDNTTLELMKLVTYTYAGGAHGLSQANYYVFDMANKRQLTLDDILVPNQKVNLEKAMKAKFIAWIKANGDNPTEYQKTWQFHITDNFIFTKDGIRFVYQPYEISPYAYGMPEFTLTYGELKGMIKSEYLP